MRYREQHVLNGRYIVFQEIVVQVMSVEQGQKVSVSYDAIENTALIKIEQI